MVEAKKSADSKPIFPSNKPTNNASNNSFVVKKQQNQNKETQQSQKKPISQIHSRKGISYPSASKRSLKEIITDNVPIEFFPTEKTGYALASIFVLVLLISITQIPVSRILAGNITNVNLSSGIPFYFVNFQLTNPLDFPIKLGGLILDLIIYIIIAYMIDVLLNYIKKLPIFTSKEDKGKYPKVYKDPKITGFVEKITEKEIPKKPAPKPLQQNIAKTKPVPSIPSKTSSNPIQLPRRV